MTCRTIEKKCQTPTAKLPISFDWMAECATYWRAGQDYEAAERMRPRTATGYEFECTTPGQSNGRKEPDWRQATTVGATIIDGSVTWTCRALSTASLQRTISTSTWAGGGLTTSGPDKTTTAGEQSTLVFITGGDAGTTYRVVNHVVFSDGSEDDGEVDIEIE